MRRTAAMSVGFILGAILVTVAPGPARADGCTRVATVAGRWMIDACPNDPGSAAPMEVMVDGVPKASAAYITVSEAIGATAPQVAVVYSSGFVRLKPGADPVAPIPFGSSHVLGPAYWADASTYHHNPNLAALDVATVVDHSLSLSIHATGTNGAFAVDWQLTLKHSSSIETVMDVHQSVQARSAVAFPSSRAAEHQAYKTAAQISSMFIGKDAACPGHFDCHDADLAHYVDAGGTDRFSSFATLPRPSFVFPSPQPLAPNGELSAIHTDNRSWQGATPTTRVLLLGGLTGITPQGFISETSDVNDDNVGLWLSDDARAAHGFAAGETDVVEYAMVAEDAEFPVIQGSTWFSSGQRSRSGSVGSTLAVYAVGAFPNVAYEMVSGRPAPGAPCALDVEPLNGNPRFANGNGFIGTTVGGFGRPPGTWQICFYEVTPGARGRVATAPATFTVVP